MRELSLNNCRIDNRYDVLEHLGRGSYAEIFLARDALASPQSPHSQVVIKALNVFLQDDLDADLERTLVENFQNEAVALDRVRHPNIISRVGHGTARDLRGTIFHYIVLEYLSGGDMQNLVRRQSIPFAQAMDYIEQISAGLGHAHKAGIIHRDIKPQNLLLTTDRSTVKIADFGVARESLADSPITRVGTNVYAPPEHSPLLAGQTGVLGHARLTPASDIYSLAKSVYTLVTREAPRAFVNQPITGLPETFGREDWADVLVRVLNKATQTEPNQRQQTVAEFWSDITAVRQIARDKDEETVVGASTAVPQAHIMRGYSPIAPEIPRFTADLDPKQIRDYSYPARPVMTNGSSVVEKNPAPVAMHAKMSFATSAPVKTVNSGQSNSPSNVEIIVLPRKKRKALRRIATFVIFFAIFGGILYGTASYMRGKGILPEIRNPFKTQTAVVNTDVNLRQSPNTDNDPIGLVTKNSKVKIVNSQNNWYQVDVIEQGRARSVTLPVTRGWLNGKYLDIDN